jgi:serine/threonine-protein kinase
VFEVGVTEDGAPFVVTEYLPGEDLGERLAREGRLLVPEAARIAIQALQGLEEAHALGAFHFNVKPENLSLTQLDGREVCKLHDFGIAKVRISRFWRHLDAEMRSLVYMAPERLVDEAKVDQRADLYSVGAVLYECLAGKPPHAVGEEAVLIERILSETPKRLDSLRPDVPRGLADAVERALAREPQDRFANAGEFIRALEPFTRSGASEVLAKVAAPVKGSPRVPLLVLGSLDALFVGYRWFTSEPSPEDLIDAEVAEYQSPPATSSASIPVASARPPRALPSLLPAPAAPAAVPAPSALPSPSAIASGARPPSSAAAAAIVPAASAPAASASAQEPALCYLNGTSGNISLKRPWYRDVLFIKPNMTNKAKFPKWIPDYCMELSVYHCGKAKPE